ncbi:hypothetical protein Ahy_B05g075397 [Arachis hypogaea]|uniref:Uncharacterized protein n=1 Tax=Arachis hypogaea TaxID=3818 RepID=A0A444Z1G5_ARAHY|nr:hypothetical protein Ahy_B05g075397 [Arachis hypogaea]
MNSKTRRNLRSALKTLTLRQSSSASLALSHLSALPPSYPLTRLCWRSHSLGAHYSPRRSANGDRLSYLRAASLCPPSSIVSSHLLYRLLSQRERWKFRFSERGPSPEHSGEAPGSLVRFRCLRQQIMDLCLQSNPYSSKALFCPFSQSFTFRYTETLDQKSDIVVPEDDHGLYAIDILDPSLFTKCIHLTEVYHFHDMIDMLVGCGYKKGTTLLGYGYDFSQSNRIDKLMDGLKAKLETAYKASGGRKVNLISHSMGGIMILCFLPLHRDNCLACPFQVVISCASLALADAGIMMNDLVASVSLGTVIKSVDRELTIGTLNFPHHTQQKMEDTAPISKGLLLLSKMFQVLLFLLLVLIIISLIEKAKS